MTDNNKAANLIARLTEVENAITDALENEDYETATALNQERDQLIKEMVSAFHQSSDDNQRQELQDFARALKEHGEQTVATLQQERDKAREELLKIKHGQSGRNLYQQVRRTR